MSNFIPVFEPLLDGNEKLYVEECFKNGWIAQNGPFTKKLEEEFSKYCKQKYGTCVANGSAALDLAVRAMKEVYNWEDNSEILVPSFNIISAAQSCLYSNLQPVFVDSEAETWNIDVSKIEQHITEKTRAIVVVHIYGLPSKMNEIIEIAKKYDLKIIEDAAQAHGQTYNNRICGSFGDITAFSFFINKNVACGEGGIVLASDERLIEKVKYYKNLCFGCDKFVHQDLGWNYRMTDIQAAIAYAQFEKLDKTIEKKKYIGNFYRNLLKDIPAKISLEKTEYAENHYWAFGVVIGEDIDMTAKEAMAFLGEKNIGTRPFFFPMHKQPIFEKMGILDNCERPVSEMLYKKGFYIPTGLNLTDDKLEYVASSVSLLFNSFKKSV